MYDKTKADKEKTQIRVRWRVIEQKMNKGGEWEVAPVSELSVEAVLIKLHTAGKGPPTDTAPLTLHKKEERRNLSCYRETSTVFEHNHF